MPASAWRTSGTRCGEPSAPGWLGCSCTWGTRGDPRRPPPSLSRDTTGWWRAHAEPSGSLDTSRSDPSTFLSSCCLLALALRPCPDAPGAADDVGCSNCHECSTGEEDVALSAGDGKRGSSRLDLQDVTGDGGARRGKLQ